MADIQAQALKAGIEPSYRDVWEHPHPAPEETLLELLDALQPMQAEDGAPPPVRIIPADRRIKLTIPNAQSWEITDETGASVEKGEAWRQSVLLPALRMGYYRLRITGAQEHASILIVAPPRCWMPEAMEKGRRVWGIAAQLYGLRSKKNAGMGDFGDLRTLVKDASALGADVVGLNPLHALFDAHPDHFSPYSPSNRLFLNTLYIDVAAVDGFDASPEAQRLWNDAHLQEKLAQVRKADWVDYATVADCKQPVLRALFTHFRAQEKPEAYARFCAEGGEDLHKQAVFDALCAYFKKESGAFVPWPRWPEAFQNVQSPEVQAFAQAHPDEVDYYRWLQWTADMQLASVQQMALSKGMLVGLYRDLAVGAEGAGAEIWMNPEAFLTGFTIGAPPDEYNPKGQNWGLPALHPIRLRARGYDTFIRMLRANMRHCRALRIDHAFGLCRLFLIPHGKDATQGAYLRYPFEELLAVIRLESHLQQCIVIGEDLGTFPPDYKEAAEESGMFSYKLLYFEKEEKGYIPPRYYPARSLATLTTHDLPTLRGWLDNNDIDEREKLDLYPNAELIAKDRERRAKDKVLLAQNLQAEKIQGAEGKTITFEQVQRYLCKSPAAIVMAQLEDVLGMATQVNLPATTDQRPNWRMKLPQTLEEVLKKEGALARLAHAMNEERALPPVDIPRATYRLQFHKDFTFADAVSILPYLKKLGISHVYASPYLKARPGSMHGYDITDHRVINPELGGEAGYLEFIEALEANGLKQILDFVPNHMDVGGADNAWWLSVLEWGRQSPFADYFDIDWTPRTPGDSPRLVVPFLGSPYGEALDKGELKLAFDAAKGSFSVWYAEHCFPLCPRDYRRIDETLGDADDPEAGRALKKRIAMETSLHASLQRRADAVNHDIDALHSLLERQHYRLAFWRIAASDINYRRFFDITNLAGMRVEVPELFDVMHERVLALIRDRRLHGLRIDHIDGLADPAGYCRRLREKAGGGIYLVVEKILGGHETLPEDWPIQGTSGYDALTLMGDVFADGKNAKAFDRIYRRFSGRESALEEMIYLAKLQILESSLESELQALSLLLKRITAHSRYTRDYPLDTLRRALREIIGWFPVYRTYVTRTHVSAADMKTLEWAVGRAKKHSRMPDVSVYDVIGSLLRMEEMPLSNETEVFVRKFQQLSGPVMAKGVEDTVFYRYNRLLSLNEVGGNPGRFGLSVQAFNETNRRRAAEWPHSMLATATHDTKRGEDMRMRLHALSEIPGEWDRAARQWSLINRSRITSLDGSVAPAPNEEYFIYQTLLGSWPFELMETPLDKAALEAYKVRIDAYMVKALREAKLHSDWNQPDEAHESAVSTFIHGVLDGGENNVFLEKFLPLAKRIAVAGALNSLSQTVLKLTLPGVPDIYQGSEYWDLSLVDPDNRRPVDYALRARTLQEDIPLTELLAGWEDGRVKQKLIAALLAHRAAHADLYRYGGYIPLKLKGRRARNGLAFMRKYKEDMLTVIVPLHTGATSNRFPLPDAEYWGDTYLTLPRSGASKNLFTGEIFSAGNIALSRCLGGFPCAVIYIA